MTNQQPSVSGAQFAPEITTPPSEWQDREEYEFRCFVFHKHEDNCINCGAVHHWADVLRAFARKTDSSSRKFLVFDKPIPASAEIVIVSLPPRRVPVCVHCLTADRTGNSVFLVSGEEAWNEAVRREREARQEARRDGVRAAFRNAPQHMDLNSVPKGL